MRVIPRQDVKEVCHSDRERGREGLVWLGRPWTTNQPIADTALLVERDLVGRDHSHQHTHSHVPQKSRSCEHFIRGPFHVEKVKGYY